MNFIYLASMSPRRYELLSLLPYRFQQIAINVNERILPGESASRYVDRLARLKAQTGVILSEQDKPVLGADTIVIIDDKIMGKPTDDQEAIQMLKTLSGKTHQIITAIAFADKQKIISTSVVTSVTFKTLTDLDISHYIQTGEHRDKAGAYAIQGKGGCFVRTINGSYHAVVGLPLVETEELFNIFMTM